MPPSNPALFYSKPKGRAILNPANYPIEVEMYLEAERKIVLKLLPFFNGIIEAGCFTGTYAKICNQKKKAYIGLDISNACIEEANKQARFFQLDLDRSEFFTLDINSLAEIHKVSKNFRKIPKEKWLLLLPFNLLGNLPLIDNTIEVIKNTGFHYLISTFKANAFTTKIRREYYQNCDLEGLKSRIENNVGVQFTDGDGFRSVAFMQHYLISKFSKDNNKVRYHDIGQVGNGVFYIPDVIEDEDIINHKH